MPQRLIRNIIAGHSLVSATRDMTVRDACRMMAQKHIGALLIVDQGRIAGMISATLNRIQTFTPSIVKPNRL